MHASLEALLLAIPRERAVFAERAEQLRCARMLEVARMKVDLYQAVSDWHAAVAKIAAEVRKVRLRLGCLFVCGASSLVFVCPHV